MSDFESMTGFGEGGAKSTFVECLAEVRSYNSRTLDIIIRGEPVAPALEASIRKTIKKLLIRGRIEISLVTHYRADAFTALAHQHGQELKAYQRGVTQPPFDEQSQHIIRYAELYTKASSFFRKDFSAVAQEALQSALRKVHISRKKEGAFLTKELRAIFKRLNQHYGAIRSSVVKNEPNAALGKKADGKQDVAEEIARIEVHLLTLREVLQSAGHQGKKMEFILQELLREFTTTGSKIGKSSISKSITLGKLEIERLREQAQNIV